MTIGVLLAALAHAVIIMILLGLALSLAFACLCTAVVVFIMNDVRRYFRDKERRGIPTP